MAEKERSWLNKKTRNKQIIYFLNKFIKDNLRNQIMLKRFCAIFLVSHHVQLNEFIHHHAHDRTRYPRESTEPNALLLWN